MKVKRWMTAPPITTHPYMPIHLAYRRMIENDVRRLPVLDDDEHLVGILTDRDARSALSPQDLGRVSGEVHDTDDSPCVKDAMSRTVFVVAPNDTIRDAVQIMHDRKISGMPVVDNKRCVGVITIQDMLEVLLTAMDHHRNEVTDEICQNTLGLRVRSTEQRQ
jgi:acetoin utilization protein AcuB